MNDMKWYEIHKSHETFVQRVDSVLNYESC